MCSAQFGDSWIPGIDGSSELVVATTTNTGKGRDFSKGENGFAADKNNTSMGNEYRYL